MFQIEGFQTIEKIFDGYNSLIYRGRRNQDNTPVILKLLNKQYPEPGELGRFRREFDIIHRIKLKGSIRAYSLEKYENSLVIVEEDFGGVSLSSLLKSDNLNLKEKLRLVLKITENLGEIHTKNIIHKDINPSNIVCNLRTGELKIIDFGISTEITGLRVGALPPQLLEGTLPYMSPEQTGRMNRTVDRRTDMYSLGATIFEIFTGRPPFTSRDMMELVHSHIAKKPIIPSRLNPEIPETLSNIILKLLSKAAEDRYQSGAGAHADLKRIYLELDNPSPDIFNIGESDTSDVFEITQKLYGRKQEVKILEKSFQNTQKGGIELTLVAGNPGVGKTTLIQKVENRVWAEQGLLLFGKFNQYQRNIPYNALSQAFRELCQRILSESDESLHTWRKRLQKSLGENGKLLIHLIPELEAIIETEPAVLEADAANVSHRFNETFLKLIKVFADHKYPLVIVLDDLQWADSASLKLIKLIFAHKSIRNLMVIGSYRTNEVTPEHPLLSALEQIEESGVRPEIIKLSPLSSDAIYELLTDSLKSGEERVKFLASVLLEKTDGNPFFLRELLRNLLAKEIIHFNYQKNLWDWNLEEVKQQEISRNVVELMIQNMRKFKQDTQEILQLAASVNNEFNLKDLAFFRGDPLVHIVEDLWPAINSGIVIPSGGGPEMLRLPGFNVIGNNLKDIEMICHFQHDRVQQAAYELTDPQTRVKNHLHIGRRLFARTPPEKIDDFLFMITEQLNIGVDLINDPKEKIKLAELNLRAGKKALLSGASAQALQRLRIGNRLIEQNEPWNTNYELSFELLEQAAAAEYQAGNNTEARKLFNTGLERGKTREDRAKIYQLILQYHAGLGEYPENIAAGIRALSEFGIEIPDPRDGEVFQTAIRLEEKKSRSHMQGIKIADLYNLFPMENTSMETCMNLMTGMSDAAFFHSPELFTLLGLKMFNIVITHGDIPAAALAYAYRGIALTIQKDYSKALEYSNLALKAANRTKNPRVKCRVEYARGAFIGVYHDSLSQSIKQLKKSFLLGNEAGDINYANYDASVSLRQAFFKGENLDILIRESESNMNFMKKTGHKMMYELNEFTHYTLLNLAGELPNRFRLNGSDERERNIINKWLSAESALHICIYSLHKTILHYLFGEYAEARKHGDIAREHIWGVNPFCAYGQVLFYQSLSLLAGLNQNLSCDKISDLEWIEKNICEMKTFSDQNPEHFEHKYVLLEAERYRFHKKIPRAIKSYNSAIQLAAENNYIQEEAIANELCALFWIELEETRYARGHLQEARYLYELWGAHEKVKELDERYDDNLLKAIKQETQKSRTRSTETTQSTGNSGASEAMDLGTVIKAIRAISGKLDRKLLLSELMKIIIENAGAHKGALILKIDGEYRIEASINLDKNENVDTGYSRLLENSAELARGLVRYVLRTGNTKIIQSGEANNFEDEYFEEFETVSVLCMPIRHQNLITGALYLENNLTQGAFTEERIELLEILLAQAAISLENAQVYDNLEELVKVRTGELEETHRRLLDTAHRAGMAEVAAAVLHNLGNALNSALVPASLIDEILRNSKAPFITKVGQLLDGHKDNLFDFFTRDKRGAILPAYIVELGRIIHNEQKEIGLKLSRLQDSLSQIQSIINLQQIYAREHGILEETLMIDAVLEDAISIQRSSYEFSDINFIRTYARIPPIKSSRHKLMLIFINLLKNAGESLLYKRDGDNQEELTGHEILLSINNENPGRIQIQVKDRGEGIPPEKLEKIFQHGFSTRGKGRGYGLHSAAIAAAELGGNLSVASHGAGQGATFILELPLDV